MKPVIAFPRKSINLTQKEGKELKLVIVGPRSVHRRTQKNTVPYMDTVFFLMSLDSRCGLVFDLPIHRLHPLPLQKGVGLGEMPASEEAVIGG
jgi:hypothetical protein